MSSSYTALKVVAGIIIIGLISLAAMKLIPGSHNEHGKNNQDMYEPDPATTEYNPDKKDLYPLYLEDTRDTVILQDTTVAILQVQIIKSWKPKTSNQ